MYGNSSDVRYMDDSEHNEECATEHQIKIGRTYNRDRAATIVQQRAQGLTLSQVARKHGISVERVRQIQLKATAAVAVPIEFDVEGSMLQLRLSTRSERVLTRAGCKTVRDVCRLTECQLWLQRRCGKKTVDEIVASLAHYGLSLTVD